jgi:hypothetical protein
MRSDGGVLYTQIESLLPQFVQQKHPQFTKFVEKYYEFMELNLLTISNVNLNEDKPIQESNDVTLTVTVATGNNAYSNSVNKYYVGGEVSPTLSVNTGTTYIFDQSDSTNLNHPLRISTTPNGRHSPGGEEYSNGVNVVAFGTPGTAGAQTSVYILPDIANTYLYYYCNNHSGMGGSINVANTTPYITLESSNTSVVEYIDFENPNRQGFQFTSGETVEGKTSGAKGIVRGKHGNTRTFIEETNEGNFQVGETVEGQTSRVTAEVDSYTRQPLNAARNLKPFQNVDKAPSGFVELFRKEFLHGMPKGMLGDKSRVLKNIKDFYRAKGNEASFKYIFRLLYGKEDVSFYYPSTDILRLSDGRWTLDKTLKIDYEQANNFAVFEGRIVKGATSNVTAVVERTVTYQVGATTISELYLSQIDANNATDGYSTFSSGETITTTTADANGDFGSATTTGILSTIDITEGGSNYSVGDDIVVSGGNGAEAAVKVASVTDSTISDFTIVDGGDGYAVGDTVTFVNEGTGGTGASARVATIVPTANVITSAVIINSVRDTVINSTFPAAGGNFEGKTANDHLSSNATTTFTATYSGTAPKKGDFIFLGEQGGFLSEDGKHFHAEAGNDGGGTYGGQEYDQEQTSTINSYDGDVAKFGTVVSVAGSTIIYAVGSVYIDMHDGSKTIKNFVNTDQVQVFDTQKDANGDAIAANGYNAVFTDTGANITFSNTPVAVTANTHHGTLTEKVTQVGAVRTIQVLSSGQGYASIPFVSVANTISTSYNNDPLKFGANSVFLKLNTAIANDFSSNTIIKNEGNTASGLVLDFIDKKTSLVDTGNTFLRVKMSTANSFSATDTITAYTNDVSENHVLTGDFVSANLVTSGSPATTVTLTQNAHGFSAGQKIQISGSGKATSDANKYNNVHTIASVTNTSVFTITLPSAASDTSAENELLTRRVVTSNLASSNTVFANTGINGNNAVIEIASISIGAIQSLTISNFGAGYTAAPTLNASSTGDGNAQLTARLGALAEYDGYFTGTTGLLSAQGRLQDNYYYQDFSYVIKTDVDVATYRDKILDLVHPAGLSMFGEVSMYLDATTGLMNSAARTIEHTQANTAQVANTTGVPSYRTYEVTLANQNTVSSNNQVESTGNDTELVITTPTAIDNRMEFPGIDFDLLLEHDNAGIGTEDAGDFIGLESQEQQILGADQLVTEDVHAQNLQLEQGTDYFATETTFIDDQDALLLEDGHSKVMFEGFYDSIVQEDGSNLELEEQQAEDNYVLFEPITDTVQIRTEDGIDEIILEDNDSFGQLVLEDSLGSGKVLCETTTIGLETDQTGNTFILINEPDTDLSSYVVLEVDEITYDQRITVTDRDDSRGFIIPKIQFPEEEMGAVHIDMGYGSQLRLETDIPANIRLEYQLQMDLLTEAGENIQTEDGNNFVATDPFHGTQGETGDMLLEDGGLVLTEDQPSETEGFDFELLLLEETNGMRPVYLAMEDSMTDEVIVATEIQIIPKGSQEVGSQVFKRESGVVSPQVDPNEGGYLTESGDRFISEMGDDAASHVSASVTIGDDLDYASSRNVAVSGFTRKLEGSTTFKSGDDFELLAEDGRRFVSESDFDLDNLLTESGDTLTLEHDPNGFFAINRTDPLQGESRAFLRAEYDRKSEVIGSGTFFDTDFNAPVTLEREDFINLIAEDSSNLIIEGNVRKVLQPEQAIDDEVQYIQLEDSTTDLELIILENSDDRVFEHIVAEDSQDLIALDGETFTSKRRLVHEDFLDIIIDESGIALEKDHDGGNQFKMEEYTPSVAVNSLVAESGDNLQLEHVTNLNFSDEGEIKAIEHLSYDLKISDFTPSLGHASLDGAPSGDIILEDYTEFGGEGVGAFTTENGARFVFEVGNNNSSDKPIHYLHEDHYAQTDSTGLITVTNDNRPAGKEPSNFKSETEQNLVAESGDNFISEVGIVPKTTVEVEIQAPDSFPHGVRDNAQIIFSDGETGQVVQAGSQYEEGDGNNTFQQYLLQVDYGSILLETEDASIDESLTGNDATSYLLDEVDGDRIKRDFGDSTPRTYTIRYGRDTRSLDDEGVLKMETCQVEHSANNDYFGGRVDHFMINGFKSRLAPFGTMQIHEIDKIFGNDISLEDGESLLIEDGELTQDENLIMLEDDTFLIQEEDDVLLLEPDGYYAGRMLYNDEEMYRIEYIANNTFLKVSSGEEVYPILDATIKTRTLEPVPS